MSLRGGGSWFSRRRHWATLHFPIQLRFRFATRTKWVTLPQLAKVIDPAPPPPTHTHTHSCRQRADTRRRSIHGVAGGPTKTKHRDTNQEICSRREGIKKTSSWETVEVHNTVAGKNRKKGQRLWNSERHTRLLLTTSVTEKGNLTCAERSRGVSRECSPRDESSHWLS
jgi:hypothetical protein